MKFLTFTDIHGDKEYLKNIIYRSKKEDIDFIITSGDLTWFGKELGYILKKLNTIGKTVYLIPGNHEKEEKINELLADCPNLININHKAVEVNEYIIFGYAEGCFSLKDSEFRKISREWYSKYQDKKTILVLHGPPYGTKIDILNKKHVGNQDFRKFIERIKPKLVISGHFHETVNLTDKIGSTSVINPGWDGMVVELK